VEKLVELKTDFRIALRKDGSVGSPGRGNVLSTQ
jgi:hypothetical protein